MSQKRVKLLQKTFPELPLPLLAELAKKVKERTYPMGTVLCREGEVEDTFYIICSGKTAVSKFLDGETSRILTYQGPGEFFGELALVQANRRVATVVTTEETTVFELSKEDFLDFLESSPDLVVTVMRAVASRLRVGDQRSIAELRRKTKELRSAYRKLEAETQQRSAFLTTVAHELHAPLATVKGYMDLLESNQFSEDTMKSVVDTVSDNVDAIIRLVNSILFLQEIELIVPQFHPVNIEDVVRQAVEGVLPGARQAKLSIHLDIAPGIKPIQGDPGSLKQAIIALLENAVKFSPNEGEIYVSVRSRDQALEIAVRDSGVGIPQADLERLFERAQSQAITDSYLSGGAGLGLPIARAVVEQHKGSVHVTSAEAKGSTFTIRLPFSSAV